MGSTSVQGEDAAKTKDNGMSGLKLHLLAPFLSTYGEEGGPGAA